MRQDKELREWQEKRLDADRAFQANQKQDDRKWQVKMAVIAATFSLLTGLVGIMVGKAINPPPATQK